MSLDSSYDYEKAARAALDLYPIKNPAVTFIRHNENLTYKIVEQDTETEYLLRIHIPIHGFPEDERYAYSGLKSEIAILTGIREHTDIAVQQPISTIEGDDVASLQIISNGDPSYCTVLSWIPGDTMDEDGADWPSQAYQTGVMTAKLHNFAEWWTPTVSLNRPVRKSGFLKEMIERTKYGIKIGLFTESQYALLKEAAVFIIDRMEELESRSDASGIIHSDLQKSNLIVHGKSISPIDFCLSGHGYFLFDLGGLSADFGPLHIRHELLSGYRSIRDLPESDMKYVEAFFVQAILQCMGFHVRNGKMHEWFRRRTAPICDEYIRPLLDDIRFYDLI